VIFEQEGMARDDRPCALHSFSLDQRARNTLYHLKRAKRYTTIISFALSIAPLGCRRLVQQLSKRRFSVSTQVTMHAARTALNRDPELKQWVELWLKNRERATQDSLSDEEFEKHWKYVRPERMHEGAVEGVSAYQQRIADH
jgi:hypothetical protein